MERIERPGHRGEYMGYLPRTCEVQDQINHMFVASGLARLFMDDVLAVRASNEAYFSANVYDYNFGVKLRIDRLGRTTSNISVVVGYENPDLQAKDTMPQVERYFPVEDRIRDSHRRPMLTAAQKQVVEDALALQDAEEVS